MDNPEKLKYIPLNEDIIKKYLRYETKILKYNELNDYFDIDTLLYPNNNVVILLEIQKNFGHWICLKKTPIIVDNHQQYIISFFDSYGKFPDLQKHNVDEKFLKYSGQQYNKISELLDKASYKYLIEYSHLPLQNINDLTIATCGQWCCIFIKSGLTVDKFYAFLKKYNYFKDKDTLCSYLFKMMM